MEIKDILKEARAKTGLTQEQVAEEIMVSRQTISNWENGKSLPDLVSALKMSDLYQVSLDKLLKGDQKMEEKVKREARNWELFRLYVALIIVSYLDIMLNEVEQIYLQVVNGEFSISNLILGESSVFHGMVLGLIGFIGAITFYIMAKKRIESNRSIVLIMLLTILFILFLNIVKCLVYIYLDYGMIPIIIFVFSTPVVIFLGAIIIKKYIKPRKEQI